MTREETLQQIYETMGLMKRRMSTSFHSAHEQLGISPAQMDLLFTIRHMEPISPKKLATKLGLTPGAVSQLLASLQQKGYITYTTDPADRRVSYISVSKTGEHQLDALHKSRHTILTEAFGRLSTEELTQYLQLQQKMLTYFEQQTSLQRQKKEDS